jgi:NADPH-dependent glutamate synthase beta subunit-like oxidoreductase
MDISAEWERGSEMNTRNSIVLREHYDVIVVGTGLGGVPAGEFPQATAQSGVYFGGEYVTPGQSVVEAAADGRRAALAIQQYLRARQK